MSLVENHLSHAEPVGYVLIIENQNNINNMLEN
jgi:hypothetical protein